MKGMKSLKVMTSFRAQGKVGIVFMNFVFFMVNSCYIQAACANPGMVLTLHVSLSRVNRTVKFDILLNG